MILCPFNGESIRKCVYGNNLLVRGEQLIKFVAILKPDDCIFDHICAPRRNTTGHPHSVCVCVCECVCKRLLFCSKCTGFTVRLTYNDISLSMYNINQCEINLELPYLWYIVVLLPQKRFWAILKDFEFAIYCKRRTQNSSESLKKTLLRQKDDKSTCMVLQINVVVVVLIVYVIKVTYIFVSVEGLRSNMKYINFFFRISM